MSYPGQRQHISPEAKKKFSLEEFAKIDKNGSGDIDQQEFRAYIQLKFPDSSGDLVRNIFESMDKNRDGKLSKEEFLVIFDKTEEMLKLKIHEDENNIRFYSQDVRTQEDGIKEVEQNYEMNPNNQAIRLNSSLGSVKMQVQNISSDLREEVIVKYMVGAENRQMSLLDQKTDEE